MLIELELIKILNIIGPFVDFMCSGLTKDNQAGFRIFNSLYEMRKIL